jgi:hypothetical protein
VVIGLPLANLQQIDQVATLVKQLHRAYLNTTSLNRTEVREVAQDAAIKLLTLAVLAAIKLSLWKGFIIFIQALRLHPRLLPPRIIAQGMRVLVRWALKR